LAAAATAAAEVQQQSKVLGLCCMPIEQLWMPFQAAAAAGAAAAAVQDRVSQQQLLERCSMYIYLLPSVQ
jgi:hypothetical protein